MLTSLHRKLPLLASLVLLPLLVSCLMTSRVPDGYLERYDEAIGLKEMGNHAAALERFRQILDDHPDLPTRNEIRLHMALCELELGRPSVAAQIYRELVSLQESDRERATVLLYLGMAELAAEEFREAAHTFQKASALQEDSELRLNLIYRSGIALQRAGDFVEARSQFERVIREGGTSQWVQASKMRSALPDYFTVQAGAFGSRANAVRTSQTLKAAGFVARVLENPSHPTAPHVVYVGQLSSFQAAKQLKKRLDQLRPLGSRTDYVIRP